MSVTAVRAALVVAAVYGYFLIFAQFAFVELLRGAGAGPAMEKAALGTMALAGIASGFLTAWRGASVRLFRASMALAALAAALAPFACRMPAALAVAVLTGAALGSATVGLSGLLPAWCGVAWLGLGTGLGYAACNLPFVFEQAPAGQAWIGAGFALLGCLAAPAGAAWPAWTRRAVFPFWAALLMFTALVWLDSAAFFIIQHEADLKSGTWGAGLLWRNAAVHLALAAAAGIWLAGKGGARFLPGAAWILLAVAALAVNREPTRALSGWLYPAGVSLYSTALVAWPAWFSGADGPRASTWRAAWLFAIAGWFGSANGIGMAQTLHHVPAGFVVVSGLVVLGVAVLSGGAHFKSALAVGVVALTGALAGGGAKSTPGSASERGRLVYISEGCIHCHSRYSRPGSPDERIWGPAPEVKETLAGEPVLIGNRRQGPDLVNIGARRSEAWLKAHFINPRALAPDSIMPSYAHLFEDGRGDDLVRYLKESGVGSMPALLGSQAEWKPAGKPEGTDARALYARHCAVCHGATGGGFGPLSPSLGVRPTNLREGPFIRTGVEGDPELAIARVIKFGVIGSDMPGHETLADGEILALAKLLAGWREK